MRVLVTTALGNVGRQVVRACCDAGLAVRAADRVRQRAQTQYPAVDVVALDFLDRATWDAALAGCGAVFVLRPPPISDMRATLIPFIDRAYAMGLSHVVFLSVAGAERMSWVPHRKVELHLASIHRRWTVLRPGFFAQNLQDAYRRDIAEDGRLYVPAGHGRVAFLDVRDVGDVAARVFLRPADFQGAFLHLTGPQALSFYEVARLLEQRLRRPVRYVPATIAGYAWHLWHQRHMAPAQIAVQTLLHVGLRSGDAEAVTDTVERILGRPATELAGYVEQTLATGAW